MKNLLLTTLIGAGVVLASCEKNEVVPPPSPTSDLNGLFTSNRNDAIQEFSMNASVYNQFTGTNGVKIQVPANSFVYANGNTVVGNITFELIEILDQSSMILMGMPTTANGEILVSGGQLKLTATQNGSQVFIAPGASVSVMVPTSNPDAQMALFNGVEDNDGNVDWTQDVEEGDSTNWSDLFIVSDTVGGVWSDYYYFQWTDPDMGWINCDYFYNDPNPKTSLSADLPDEYNQTNTSVFLHYTSINSVSQMYFYTSNYFSGYNIPVGMQVTVVCISEIDGDYFSAFVPVTVSTGLVVPVTMNSTTLADIEAAIDNL